MVSNLVFQAPLICSLPLISHFSLCILKQISRIIGSFNTEEIDKKKRKTVVIQLKIFSVRRSLNYINIESYNSKKIYAVIRILRSSSTYPLPPLNETPYL